MKQLNYPKYFPLENIKNNECFIPLFKLLIDFKTDYYKANPITIPFFQRNYEWNRTIINTLFNDIEEHINKNNGSYYWLGVIFTSSGTDNEHYTSIMDGQQRLLTFLILYNLLCLETEEGDILTLQIIDNRLPKIIKEEKNKLTFYSITDYFKNKAYLGLDENHEKIKKIIEIFKSNIKKLNNNGIETLKLKEYMEKRITITNLVVENDYMIFENINSKGVKLSLFDQVYSFLLANPHTSKFILDENNINYYSSIDELRSKDIKDKKEFIDSFIKMFTNPKEDITNSSYNSFKEFILNKINNEDFSIKMKNLILFFQYMDEYLFFLSNNKNINFYLENPDIAPFNENDFTHIYFMYFALEINRFLFFVLNLMVKNKFLEKSIVTDFFTKIAYLDFWFLLFEGGQDLDGRTLQGVVKKIVKKFLDKNNTTDILDVKAFSLEIKKDLYDFYSDRVRPIDRYLDENSRINYLSIMKNHIPRSFKKRMGIFYYLLFDDSNVLQDFNQKHINFVSKFLRNNNKSDIFTIEHIIPKNFEEDEHNDNENKEKIDIHCIANIVYITKHLNSKVKDKTLDEKMEIYDNHKDQFLFADHYYLIMESYKAWKNDNLAKNSIQPELDFLMILKRNLTYKWIEKIENNKIKFFSLYKIVNYSI